MIKTYVTGIIRPMSDKVFITKERKIELEAELLNLKTSVRPEILKRLQFAKSLGDLSENAEYHASREEQGKNEDRIKEIEHILKNHEIIEKNESGEVGLASVVTVQKDGPNSADGQAKPQTFTIVGPAEADMAQGKLSSESPIGAALMGKKAGDTAEVTTPGGVSVFNILEVK